VRRNRNSSIASTTASDLAVVAQDMLRMGKHWTQAAQDWLDRTRNESADLRRQARRNPRDMQSDFSGGGYDQVRTPEGAAAFGARTGSGSYRGIGPRNYSRSDERIREDINERLTEADDLDASDLTVEVSNGVVTLSGGVDERWMKHRAEDIADGCSGVRGEVAGNLHTNTGTSAGTGTATGTAHGTGTNTHQDTGAARE